MARTLTAGMNTAVAAETGAVVYLIEINSSDGTTRINTSATDISWDSQTWTAVGGLLVWDGVQELADLRAQGVTLTLSGVEQSILAEILTYHMRGRAAVINLAHIATDGTIVSDPYEIFSGYLNDRWTVRDTRDEAGGTVTISTRIVSRIAIMERSSPVLCSLSSHREMLRRSGATGAALGDTFFTKLPAVVAEPTYWGTINPTGPGNPGDGTYVT